MNSEKPVAATLADLIDELEFGHLSAEAVHRGKVLLLDQLGCQLIGSSVPWNRAVYQYVKENNYGGPASVVNHGDRVPIEEAAFVNGTFGQGCELDDYYDQGGGHPGAASVPVALALAQKQPVSGKRLLTAVAAGYEVGWRVGRALLPGMMRRGYHAQGVVGVYIAVTTAAKLLSLTPDQLIHALAIAGSHCSGTMEYDQSGGEVKRMHNGMACSGGLRSAMLAQIGLTGPATIFEGERGILKVFSGQCNIMPIISDMGSDLGIMHAAIKRFPVNASQHAPIELLDKLVKDNSIRASDIKSIQVYLNEGVILHGGTIYEPTQVIEAQFSLRFSLALRLLKGSNDLKFYLDPMTWRDRDILEVGKKIKLSADPTAEKERRFACKLKISMVGGNSFEGDLASPKGSFANPLSATEAKDKFLELGSAVLDRETLSLVIDRVANIEEDDDVSSLAALLRQPHGNKSLVL